MADIPMELLERTGAYVYYFDGGEGCVVPIVNFKNSDAVLTEEEFDEIIENEDEIILFLERQAATSGDVAVLQHRIVVLEEAKCLLSAICTEMAKQVPQGEMREFLDVYNELDGVGRSRIQSHVYALYYTEAARQVYAFLEHSCKHSTRHPAPGVYKLTTGG
jgi:hypothetical protein